MVAMVLELAENEGYGGQYSRGYSLQRSGGRSLQESLSILVHELRGSQGPGLLLHAQAIGETLCLGAMGSD